MGEFRRALSRRSMGFIGAGVVVVLVVGGLTALALRNAELTGVDCAMREVSSAEVAQTTAAACDTEIEVLDDRTPWESTWALPNGEWRLDMSAKASRTNVNGAWEDIDVSVGAAAADGMLSVEAPVFEMSVNAGVEDRPLGVIERYGQRFEMWFPLSLPEPTVEGSRAVYDLAAGVRVVVEIMPDGAGFTPVIELDSPAAAAWFEAALYDARAAKGLPGSGWDVPFATVVSEELTVKTGVGGSIRVVDAEGESAFVGPPSLMWDSAGGDGIIGADPMPEADLAAAIAEAEQDGSDGRELYPWPGDRVEQMPVRVEDEAIVVSVSASMLADPETAWPVRIDPSVSGQTANEWIAVRTGGFTSTMYKWHDTTPYRQGEGVGRCNQAGCNTNFVSRLVWQFGGMSTIRDLVADDVTSAQFSVFGAYSYTCSATKTNLWMTDGISASSNWNLGWISVVGSRTDAHRDSCGNQGWREYDATAALRTFAQNDLPTITLGLRADQETTMTGWKRFSEDAKVSVQYNRRPAVPSSVKLSNPPKSCVTGSSRPAIATSTPTLSARTTDPDGGNVQVKFQIVNTAVTQSVWSSGFLTAKASGATFTKAVPEGILANNQTYGFRAQASDGTRSSSWSSVCEFRVDSTKPPGPTITPVTAGVQAVYSEGEERGGVGLEGKWTLDRGSKSDATKFRYQIGARASVTVTIPSGGKLTVPFTPTRTGPVELWAEAIDAAGNVSERTSYEFDIAAAKEDGIWMLDDIDDSSEGERNSAADTSGIEPSKPLLLHGDVATMTGDGPHTLFQSRPGDKALVFDGVGSYAQTGGPVVDTRESFTVSAFVKLNAAAPGQGKNYRAVSQMGTQEAGFALMYQDECPETASAATPGCWAFIMKTLDSPSSGSTQARSSVPVVADEWVMLVGEHNASTRTMRMWACTIGTPENPTAAVPESTGLNSRSSTAFWQASGPLMVGAGKRGATLDFFWPGSVDNIRVFSGQVVAESKIRRMCQGAEARDFGSDAAIDPTVENDE